MCNWYKRGAYERTYAQGIMPIKTQGEWPESERPAMKRPTYRKQLGRPKKARRLEHDEIFQPGHTWMRRVYNKNHCKICEKE